MDAIIVFGLSVLLATNVNLSNPPPNVESLSNTVAPMEEGTRKSSSTFRSDNFFSSLSSNVTNNYQDRHSVTTEKNSVANVIPITSDRNLFENQLTGNKDQESSKSMTVHHITDSTKVQPADKSTTPLPASDMKAINSSYNQHSMRTLRLRKKKNYNPSRNNKLNPTFIHSADTFSNDHKYVKSISENINNTVHINEDIEVFEDPTCTEVPNKIGSSVSPETSQSSTFIFQNPEVKKFDIPNRGLQKTEESQILKPFKIETFHGDRHKELSVTESPIETISRINGRTRERDQSISNFHKIVARVHVENRKLSLENTNNAEEKFSTHTGVSYDLRSTGGTPPSAYDYINGRNVRHVKKEGLSSADGNSETGSITPHSNIENTLTTVSQTHARAFHIQYGVTDNVNNTDDSADTITAFTLYKNDNHDQVIKFDNNKLNAGKRQISEGIKAQLVTPHELPEHVENWIDVTKSTLRRGNGEFSLENVSIINYSSTFNSYDLNPPILMSTEIDEADFYTYNTTPVYNVDLTSSAENYTDLYVNQTTGYSYNGDNYLDSYLELVAVNGSEDHNTSRETTVESALHVNVSGWPVKLSAVVEGEIVLGGLMMVHERSDTVTCGPVMPQGGVQALETMLYTLDRLNAHPSLLPNVTLGAHILDDCDKDTYGLEMAVDFIKGRISELLKALQIFIS